VGKKLDRHGIADLGRAMFVITQERVSMNRHIVVAEGDGVGPEIMEATLKII
jgi:hypothetical protein